MKRFFPLLLLLLVFNSGLLAAQDAAFTKAIDSVNIRLERWGERGNVVYIRATVNGNIFQAGSTTLITPINHMVTFSFYKNGVLIPNSSRTRTQLPSDISLLALSTIEAGDTVDVRWKIDEQISDGIEISVFNRILTLIKVGN